ncbi:MAG: hypothetical protein NPINA01_24250 [Nitrospinaceae bacterium]|nr:MAG: hypothetical protein NPINA01_24250 [Nitrospinaceae bacterium]
MTIKVLANPINEGMADTEGSSNEGSNTPGSFNGGDASFCWGKLRSPSGL